MSKLELLKTLNFGQSVAEDDDGLSEYFVETDTWNRLVKGEIDIFYGAKGSGKSALYRHLLHEKNILKEKNIDLLAAERVTGAAIFKTVLSPHEISEASFKHIWLLYIISLIGNHIKDNTNQTDEVKIFINKLKSEKLLEGTNLKNILIDVKNYVVNFFNKVEEIEYGMSVHPETGTPVFGGKILMNEPNYEQRNVGMISVNDLLDMAQDALESIDKNIWIAFDRLDVSFVENTNVEKVAIRTLFQVYNDLKAYKLINLKIFMRDDIWKRITIGGFREASHITKTVTIQWSEQNLMHLLINRILDNDSIIKDWKLDKEFILSSSEEQDKFFYKVFPTQLDSGSKKPKTFKWMLSRVEDGQGVIAPRELIQLLNESKRIQINKFEIDSSSENEFKELISRNAIREALDEVSKTRLEQVIYAEYPELTQYIKLLETMKSQHTLGTLAVAFGLESLQAKEITEKLVEIGFFEKRKSAYWIPFLYRPALKLVQGSEDQVR